jgi:PadR family transcriptional regulator, regulatory protein PadR
MARTDALQGSLDLLVLKILSRRPRLHGYAIMSAIQVISAEVLRVEEGLALSCPASHGRIRLDWR